MSDAEAEAAETQTWLEFALECTYLDGNTDEEFRRTYDHILGMLVRMIGNPSPWLLLPAKARE